MKIAKLSDMKRGWFIGSFQPTLADTEDVEVAVKKYNVGEYEDAHYHKVATEYTLIISGQALMFGQVLGAGDIIVVDPNDTTDFLALTEVKNVVVKLPGVKNDKYLVTQEVIDSLREATLLQAEKLGYKDAADMVRKMLQTKEN